MTNDRLDSHDRQNEHIEKLKMGSDGKVENGGTDKTPPVFRRPPLRVVVAVMSLLLP
jgi:hypothetical protein